MSRSKASLDALIHELDEVRSLAGANEDPSLSEASLAVARALSALGRLGNRRFNHRLQADDAGDDVIADARRALSRAREALVKAAALRHSRPAADAVESEPGEPQGGAVAVSCCGCGRRFFVKYQGSPVAAPVTFPMACPWEECEAVTEVAYPEDATLVEVQPAVR